VAGGGSSRSVTGPVDERLQAGGGPRSRYSTAFGRRYILIRWPTLVPAVAIDLLGYGLRRLLATGHRGAVDIKRILAIRLDHIGDVLITTPALRLLRQGFPKARLDVLAGSWAAELLRDDPDLDRIRTFDAGWYGGGDGLGRLARLIRTLRRERYDLVIDFRGDLRHLMLARIIGAPLVFGYGIRGGGFLLTSEVPYDESAHEVERALSLARVATGDDGDPGGLIIRLRPEDEAAAQELFHRVGVDARRLLVALCPASRNRSRWWQGEKFTEVARHLVERYRAEVLVFGDASSTDAAASVIAAQLPGVRPLMGRTSLRTFAAALARVDLIVSVESSPIHFASALNKPIVTLFGGSSLPAQWGPYRTEHRIVHRQVPCSPCHLLRCPLPQVLCMEAITPVDVTRACDELLTELAERDPALEAKLVGGPP